MGPWARALVPKSAEHVTPCNYDKHTPQYLRQGTREPKNTRHACVFVKGEARTQKTHFKPGGLRGAIDKKQGLLFKNH